MHKFEDVSKFLRHYIYVWGCKRMKMVECKRMNMLVSIDNRRCFQIDQCTVHGSRRSSYYQSLEMLTFSSRSLTNMQCLKMIPNSLENLTNLQAFALLHNFGDASNLFKGIQQTFYISNLSRCSNLNMLPNSLLNLMQLK